MADNYDFSGVWHSSYTYISSRRGPGEYTSEHNMLAQRRGNRLVFQSMPTQDGSFLLVRLRLDGRIATGGWEETTSPDGPFKGTRFYGPLMFVLDEDGKALRGMWLGVGRQQQVKANKWEIVHRAQSPAHLEVA